MGSRGAGSGRTGSNDLFNKLPASIAGSGKITKRSQEVFDREYTNLRLLANDLMERGDYKSSGYNTLHASNDEPVFTKPVLKGINTLIEKEWDKLNFAERNGLSNPERIKKNRYALTMMRKMTNKYYNSMYGDI